MPEQVRFKFFEGQDVEQFTFYRIPKQLFTLEYFKGMSSDAKVLYGLMLDRVSLSLKNNWFDDDNKAYIYFSIDDVMELLGCGKNKAVKCLKELDEETGIGLTQKRRQGFGKSNMIYVKTFIVEGAETSKKAEQVETEEMKTAEKQTSVQGKPDPETAKKQTSVPEPYQKISREQTSVQDESQTIFTEKSGKNALNSVEINQKTKKSEQICPSGEENATDSVEDTCQNREMQSLQKFENQTNEEIFPDTEVYISNFKKFKKQTSRSPKNKLLEVYFSNPNKTEYNKTKYSYNKSYRILSGDGDSLPIAPGMDDTMRCDEEQTEAITRERAGYSHETGAIYDLVRDNIDLDGLLAARQEEYDLILEIYRLIVEMVSCRSKEIVIASSRYPADLVRSRFLKLRYDHIIYVMDCLEKNTSKVRNIRKYLLTALFNASATMDGYYRAEVRHDMPMMAQGTP